MLPLDNSKQMFNVYCLKIGLTIASKRTTLKITRATFRILYQ